MAAAAPTPPREHLIAVGASARLFTSRDADDRPAALKLSRSSDSDASLLAEVAAAARLSHPALLPIWAHGWDEAGRVWLLMPLLSGQTLANWRPEVPALLDALGPIADVLDLLHHIGYGHADLKPANIMVGEVGGLPRLLLGDLGLISTFGAPAPGGTPAYLSPARLDGRPFTWRDDLHAFAVLTFECLTDSLPWSATSGDALLREIRVGRVGSMHARRPDLPGELDVFFAQTLRAGSQHSCVMGWLDELRGHFGLPALPRCLFLVDDQAAEVELASRGALAAWLQAHLRSATSRQLEIGHEELRTLEELARGEGRRLRRLLAVLLREQWLQDQSGQVVFSESPTIIGTRLRQELGSGERAASDIPAGWQGLLSALPIGATRRELADTLAISTSALDAVLSDLSDRGLVRVNEEGQIEGSGLRELRDLIGCAAPLPAPLFELLWDRSHARPGTRLMLLGLAQASGAEALLATRTHSEVLDLIERAPGEVCDGLREFLAKVPKGKDAELLLGLLDVVRLVRTDALDAALNRYWAVDGGLTVQANASLNRLLVYQLSDAGRVHDAQAFLERWRQRHGSEIVGSPVEIQIAARELNILGTFGAHAEAAALAAQYMKEFAGREGAWILHMALASLAEDRGDRANALMQSERALVGVKAESSSRGMELDLLAYLAATIIASSDRERWQSLEPMLDRAEALARELEIHTFTHRLRAAKALRLLYQGDVEQAKASFLRIRHSAERSGELRRATYIDTGLVMAARETADYQWLLEFWPRFSEVVQEKESIREVLSFKEEQALLSQCVGDLQTARETADAALEAAATSGQILFEGFFHGIRGTLHVLDGQPTQGASALHAAVTALQKAHSLRRRNEYQLELIAADPDTDPDGSLIAAVIDHEEAVGERRLLPRAWQLEARRLRRAGGIREAGLALEEAFRVAGTLVSSEHRWPLHVEAAELALAAGDRQAARADLERAVAILHDLSLQFTDAPVRERFLARPDRRAVLARLRSLGAE
jgi:hypothetical protein